MRKEGVVVFDKAVEMAIRNMEESGGIGHTAGIFSNDNAHIRYYSERIPVARVLVNQPTPDAWGPATNSLSPAVSEGCGSWGNNIRKERLTMNNLKRHSLKEMLLLSQRIVHLQKPMTAHYFWRK